MTTTPPATASFKSTSSVKKFNGDIVLWLDFWDSFSEIHTNTGLTDKEKFNHLYLAMIPNSPAWEVVESFKSMPDNYQKAVTVLQSKFWQEDSLIEHYSRELNTIVSAQLLNGKRAFTLSNLHAKLSRVLGYLEKLGVLNYKCSIALFPLVESALPDNILDLWQGEKFSLHQRTNVNMLLELMLFLRREVEKSSQVVSQRISYPCDRSQEFSSNRVDVDSNVFAPTERQSPGNRKRRRTEDNNAEEYEEGASSSQVNCFHPADMPLVIKQEIEDEEAHNGEMITEMHSQIKQEMDDEETGSFAEDHPIDIEMHPIKEEPDNEGSQSLQENDSMTCDAQTQTYFEGENREPNNDAAIPVEEEKEDEVKENLTGPSDSINSLNDYCLQNIFSYLPFRDLIKIERVCKRWKQNSQASWRKAKCVDFKLDFKTKCLQINQLEKVLKLSGEYITKLICSGLNKKSNLPAKAAVEAINKYCKRLTQLDISYTWSTKNYLEALDVNLLKNLKSLTVGSHKFSDEHLSEVLEKAVNLEEFGVTGYDYRENQFSHLSEKCKTLAVTHSKTFTDAMLTDILGNHPNIKNLDISGTSILPSTLVNYTNQLASLCLWHMEEFFFAPIDVYELLTFPNLKILDLNYNDGELAVDVLTILIQNCPEIEDLRLRRNKMLNRRDFRLLKNLRKLAYLDVSYTKISDAELIFLAGKYFQLKKLFCYGCNGISEAGLNAIIAASPQLTYLAISSTKITKTFVKSILKSLQLRTNKVPLSISLRSKDKDKIPDEIKKLRLKDGIEEFSKSNILRIVSGGSNCECNFSKNCLCFDDEDTLLYFG